MAQQQGAPLECCVVCFEESPRYAAVGRCGHADVCWLCAIRLRAYLNDLRCPVCKETLQEVALVRGDGEGAQAVELLAEGAAPRRLRDERFGMIYCSEAARDEAESLFDYSCHVQECTETQSFDTLDSLKAHVAKEHGLQYCQTCLMSRKVFVWEQALYGPEELARHRAEGDRPRSLGGRHFPPTPPHADCGFCKRGFYDKEELLQHMQQRHHLCGICEKQGRSGEYYRDYSYLSCHYQERHYVCTHGDCQQGPHRLVAFATPEELQVHEIAQHTEIEPRKAQRGKKSGGVRLAISMGAAPYREEQEQRRRGQQAPRQPPEVREAAAAGGGPARSLADIPVRFMWTKERVADHENEGRAREQQLRQEEARRYPARPRRAAPAAAGLVRGAPAGACRGAPPSEASEARGAGRWARRPAAAASPAEEPPPPPAGGRAQPSRPASLPRPSGWGPRDLQLLGEALQQVEAAGLDAAGQMEPPLHRERNLAFKSNLQAVLGVDQLSEFKDISSQFRRSLAAEPVGTAQDCGELVAVRTYAEQVLRVFSAAQRADGAPGLPGLLAELILLLPDAGPRHSLYSELRSLLERSVSTGEASRPGAGAFARRQAARRAALGGGAPSAVPPAGRPLADCPLGAAAAAPE